MDSEELSSILAKELKFHDYRIESPANLFHKLTAGDRPEVDPDQSDSAFEVGMLISKVVRESPIPRELVVPKVAIEVISEITTDDIILYSDKALKHKDLYPYIRCGIVLSDEEAIPNKFFNYGRGIDFALAITEADDEFIDEIKRQVLIADKFESNLFGDAPLEFYSAEPIFRKL